MERIHPEDGRYRVLLKGIQGESPERRETFCKQISDKYNVSFSVVRDILDRCPIILRKNLSLRKAETLAKTLKHYGALISVEEKKDGLPIGLEFQETGPPLIALESTRFWKTLAGTWTVTGRVRNISSTSLNDVWILIQLFENPEILLTFEEVRLSINPLPPGEFSPFKALFEEGLSVQQVSVALKHSSGEPIPTEDRRKKREWAEVEVEAGNEQIPLPLSPSSDAGSPSLDVVEPMEENSEESRLVIQEDSLQNLEPESPPPLAESYGMGDVRKEMALEDNRVLSIEEHPSSTEVTDSPPPAALDTSEEKKAQTSLASEEGGESPDHPPEPLPKGNVEPSVFHEATKLLEEIDQRAERLDEIASFAWIEQFRVSVMSYDQGPRDPFWVWFRSIQEEHGFENELHGLVTILAHSRFDQMSPREKALENSQKVFQLLMRPNLSFEAIPPLAGTDHFSAENWRNLFHKAIPRLQQIGREIAAKERWDAQELERLIQVIPHMSIQTSRRASRWINELTPEITTIDFSRAPVIIGETLYRVATRLGVVDPQLDAYQDVAAMGYTKIQVFAKRAFPEDPVRIEEPMTHVGMDGREGHCFPTRPQCDGCLFEGFCPKLHIPAAPLEKGMNDHH